MTLDEMINHVREVAEENREEAMNAFFPPYADECESCAEEHEQLVSWLEELKDYRRFNGAKTFDNGFKQGEKYGYNKAIDDLTNKLTSDEFQKYNLDFVFETSKSLSYNECISAFCEYIEKIANELKECAE